MAENNNTPNEIKNENDKFFKGTMSLQLVAKAYIQQFVPENILDKLDIDTLELDNNSYITDELSEFFADMVWQCRYKKGSRYAKISFLHEHKSYKPKYPHFQLLDYIREAWRQQTASDQDPILTVPIVLYHGLKTWELEPMESYFGDLEADFLRFLPSFDFIFINLQKYSDKFIQGLDSIFLQKSLLAFKHHLDKTYLKEHIVELIFSGYNDEITEQMRRFMRMITVYLTAISGMSSAEIKEKINTSDNILKSKAMTIFDEIEEKALDKGRTEGRTEGIHVIKLWLQNVSILKIAESLDLTVEQVKKLIANFQSQN